MLDREIMAVCSEIRAEQINTLCDRNIELLGAFAELRKATADFVVYVRPSVPPHGTIRIPLDGFSLNMTEHIFETLSRNSGFVKI